MDVPAWQRVGLVGLNGLFQLNDSVTLPYEKYLCKMCHNPHIGNKNEVSKNNTYKNGAGM